MISAQIIIFSLLIIGILCDDKKLMNPYHLPLSFYHIKELDCCVGAECSLITIDRTDILKCEIVSNTSISAGLFRQVEPLTPVIPCKRLTLYQYLNHHMFDDDIYRRAYQGSTHSRYISAIMTIIGIVMILFFIIVVMEHFSK